MDCLIIEKTEWMEIESNLTREIGFTYPVALPLTAWKRYIRVPELVDFVMDERVRALSVLNAFSTLVSIFNSIDIEPFLVYLEVDKGFARWSNELRTKHTKVRQVRFRARMVDDTRNERKLVLLEPFPLE